MSFISRKFKLGLVATALAMTAVVSVSYAFAASNTVPASKAGYKTSVVSGYTISAIHYVLDGTDPTLVNEVDFTVDTAPVLGSTAKIQIDSIAGDWYSCLIAVTAVTCDTSSPQATAAAIDELNVVIAD